MPSGTRRELCVCALLSGCLALLQWWPVFQRLDATGFGDWQMIHHNWEAAFISLSRFGEWPLWDPFHCGGVPILGNPESQLYSPWFWLSFLFGTVAAVKLMLLGYVACAACGMYWLARCRYQLQPAAAGLAAVAWSCGGCFVWDGVGGHATFLSFAFAPWLSFFIHRDQSWLRDAAAVSLLLLLSLVGGGTYPIPFFVLWIGFELASRGLARKASPLSLGKFAAVSFGLTALCGAIRLLPIALTLQAHPRQVPNRDVLSLADVWSMLTARTHEWRVPGHPFVWPEYGSYMGVAVVLLALLGVGVAVRRSRLQLIIALLFYTLLMLGNFSELAPYSLLHHLPIYDSLRVPSRLAVFVTFYVALLAAHALDAALAWIRNPRVAAAVGVVCVLCVCGDVVSASRPIVEMWNEPPLSDAAPAEQFHLVARYAGYASYPRLNVGTPACYVGGMNWPVSRALWVGEEPQARLVPKTGELRSWSRTPNSLRAAVSLPAPARLRFDQNFARGFVSNAGVIVDDEGLLAVDLPAGEQEVVVRYRPAELIPSAALSGIGLALLLLILLRRRTPESQSAPARPSSATTPARAGWVP